MRIRLFWAFIAFSLGAAPTWFYREAAFNWLLIPANEGLSPFDGGPPVFTGPTDMFGATIRLAMWAGLALAIPVLVFGIFTLAAPAMTAGHRRFLNVFLPASVLFFLGGVAFVYYVMLPASLKFLLGFGDGVAIPLITLPKYLELLMQLMFWVGVAFELPLVMFLVAKLQVISYQRLKSVRKFVPFTAFFLAAIITPGFDPLTSTMVALPIIGLYEFGLFLAWTTHPQDGDYLWLRSIGNVVTWILRRPAVAYSKAKGLARKVLRRDH